MRLEGYSRRYFVLTEQAFEYCAPPKVQRIDNVCWELRRGDANAEACVGNDWGCTWQSQGMALRASITEAQLRQHGFTRQVVVLCG